MNEKALIEHLMKLKLIHPANLAELIYPDIPKNQASAKLRNKINQTNGNKLTDSDWELILSLVRKN